MRRILLSAIVGFTIVGFVLGQSGVVSGQQPVASRLSLINAQLIRCTLDPDPPCFRFEAALVDDSGQIAALPPGGDIRQIRVTQTKPIARAYEPFYISGADSSVGVSSGTNATKRYVLVLLDVSGSMTGSVPGGRTKYDAAKQAALQILDQFRRDVDFVAVVPFESHGVTAKVDGARFSTDTDEVRARINNLPQPNPRGNTALYSAVLSGIGLLEKQDASSSKLLLVLTDGINDIQPGDDNGLLQGSEGLNAVIARERVAQISVRTIGLGQAGTKAIDEDAMRRLAYPSDTGFTMASSAASLSLAFQSVRSQVLSSFRVTTMLDEKSFQELTGSDRSFRLVLEGSGLHIESPEWSWSSPVTGKPSSALAGDAEEQRAFYALASPVPPSALQPEIVQVATLLLYTVVIAILWFFVPSRIWPQEAVTANTPPIPGQRLQPLGSMNPAAKPSGSFGSSARQTIVPGLSGGAPNNRTSVRVRPAAASGPQKRSPQDATRIGRPGQNTEDGDTDI